MDRNTDASRTVVGCLLATVVSSTPVVNATFGVFLVPISHDLHWPRARVSVVLIIMALLCAATYPLVGRLADRLGVRRVVLVGNLLFAASVASLSFTGGSAARTYTLFALLGITSAIPSAMLYAKLVSVWFSQRRGLLLGLVGGVGNGVGCTLMPMLAGAAIAAWGWRNAYVALALVVLCVGLPAIVLLLRDPPAAPTRTSGPALSQLDGLTLGQSMHTVRFWSILGVMALGAGSLTAVFTHVVALLTDRGIGLPIATLSVGVIAMTGSFWQLVLGTVLDRTGSPRIMAPFFLLAVAGLGVLGTATSPAALLAGAFLIGLGIGTDYGAIPYLVGRYFGLRAYGAICGMIFGINVIVLGISPFLTDLVYDRTGSYHLALLAIAACLVLCAGLCLTLPRYGQGRRIPTVRVRDCSADRRRRSRSRPAECRCPSLPGGCDCDKGVQHVALREGAFAWQHRLPIDFISSVVAACNALRSCACPCYAARRAQRPDPGHPHEPGLHQPRWCCSRLRSCSETSIARSRCSACSPTRRPSPMRFRGRRPGRSWTIIVPRAGSPASGWPRSSLRISTFRV